MIDWLSNIIFIVTIGALILLEVYRTKFISLLKDCENEIWRSLGQPSGFFLSYLIKMDGFSLERYIHNKVYLNIDSEELKSIAEKLRSAQIFTLLMIVLCVVVVVLGLAEFSAK